MSTLSVSQIQNTASPTTNIVLNADGSVTVGLYRAGIAPTPVQTGTLWYDIGGAGLVIWNGANWVGVGGGSGTVTGVTGTLPIVSTGGAAPVLSINAATAALPGSVQLANAAASQAGTSATLVSTPAFSVPKDAAGMTGAALIPTGTQLQRPTPVAGMLRMNTTLNPDTLEAYDGTTAAWRQVAYVPTSTAADLTYSVSGPLAAGVYVCKNLTINVGVTLTASSGPVVFQCYGDVVINGTINTNGGGGYGGPGSGPYGGAVVLAGASGFGFGATGRNYPYTAQSYGSGAFSGGYQGATAGSVAVLTSVGGSGGGGIIIISQSTFTFGAAGSLTANGSDGVPLNFTGTDVYSQGPGGGAGGLIQLESSGNMTLAGTLSVNGGNGGAGVATGITVGSGARGGGGGGGGVIYIKCANGTLTDTSAKSLTGGAAGATDGITGPAGFGANGAGFGGPGGSGGRNTPPGVGTAAQPGGVGVVVIG